MTRIVVKPNKDYQGPRTMPDLIKAIQADAEKEGRTVSLDEVHLVISSFFSKKGLIGFLQQKKRAVIENFGTFTWFAQKRKKTKKKNLVGKKQPRARKPGVISLQAYRVLQANTKKENHLRRIVQCREELFKLRDKNKEIISRGKKPWTFRQYCCVIHETELIAYEKLVRGMQDKKIADMNSGIFEQGDVVSIGTDDLFVFYGKINDTECYICQSLNDYSPHTFKWGRKNFMKRINISMLKPYIDENLFFI